MLGRRSGGTDFHSQAALAAYLRQHPNADASKHQVIGSEGANQATKSEPKDLPFSPVQASKFRSEVNAVGAASRSDKPSAVIAVKDASGPHYMVVTAALGQKAEAAGFAVTYPGRNAPEPPPRVSTGSRRPLPRSQ